MQQRAKQSLPWLSVGSVALAAGWALLLLLAYGASRAGVEPQAWDPYAVLGLPPSADVKEVKRVYRELSRTAHPDKGGDEEAFVGSPRRTALTDPDTRENWELYGNPDGPARSWGIRCRAGWSTPNTGTWWSGCTRLRCSPCCPRASACGGRARPRCRRAVRAHGGAVRGLHQNCPCPTLSTSSRPPRSLPWTCRSGERTMRRRASWRRLPSHGRATFNRPSILKARALLYAYLYRMDDDLPPALQSDLVTMLARLPLLINTMLRVSGRVCPPLQGLGHKRRAADTAHSGEVHALRAVLIRRCGATSSRRSCSCRT